MKPLLTAPRLALLAAVSGIATSTSLHAQTTETWVGNTDSLWSTAANWSTAAPVSGDSVIFDVAGTSGATLNNDILSLSLATLTLNSGASAYTIGGNDLTLSSGVTDNATNAQVLSTNIALSAANTWSVASGGMLTASGAISGSTFGITKSGSGTLVLSGSNTYTGATVINAGTLTLRGASALSTGSALSMSSGATLGLQADADTTFTPASFGNLTAGSTYNISVASQSGSATGKTLSITSPAGGGGGTSTTTLNVNGTAGQGYTLKFTTTFATNSSSGGAWNAAANNIFNLTNADVILNAGLSMGNNGDGGITVASTTGNTLTINGNVATNTNRTTNATVSSGTLTLNNTVSLGGANQGFFVFLNGGTLNVNNAGAIRNNRVITGTSAGLAITGGTLDNTSGAAKTLTYNPTVLLNGDFAFSTAGGTSNNDLNLGTGAAALGPNAGTVRTITTNGSATLTLGGAIANGTTANGIIKAGTGTLKLGGANTFTGGVTINAGTLDGTNSAALGTGALTIAGGTLTLNGTSVQTVSGISSLSLSSGTIAFTLTSAASFDQITGSGTFSLTGGTIDLTNSVTDYVSTYQILNFTSGGTVSGIAIGNYDTTNYTASLSNSGVLSFAAVPEPNVVALLALGLGGVIWRLRRVRLAH